MKKLIVLSIAFVLLLFYFTSTVHAQGVGINSSGSNPDPAALLDLNSTTKGLLMPRMTTSQRNAITNVPQSLLIFNITTKCFEYWDNGAWQTLACTPCPLPLAPAAGTHVPSTTQIAWNWNTVSGATGYKWSTTTNVNSATDVGTATTYTQTGLTCNVAYTLYVWAYNTCGYSASYTTLTQSTSACPWFCGNNLVVNHDAGSVAPVSKIVSYGTVTSSLTGASKCWILQNLGASQQATAATDNTEASAGWYWQFNRMQGYKHDGSTRTPNSAWIVPINENSNWISSSDPCLLLLGTGWRIPTLTEWTNTVTNTGWNNYNDTYSNGGLKIHAAGDLRYNTGALEDRGSSVYMWSSIQNTTFYEGKHFTATASYAIMNNNDKDFGFSLRCIKD